MFEITKRYELRFAPNDVVKQYWEEYANKIQKEYDDFEESVSQNERDRDVVTTLSFKKSYAELINMAVSLEQYKVCHSSTYEPVTRLLRIRIDLARPLIEKYLGLKTISLYGIGLYSPIEGLILSETFRKASKYDESFSPLKGSPAFDISSIPEEVKQEYDFRFTIPAGLGLFVPKRCRMTDEWIGTAKQLEYFDMTL